MINNRHAITDKAIPVTNRCLFHSGLSNRLMISPQAPFNTVRLTTTANTILIQSCVPLISNKDADCSPSPLPKTGINRSNAVNTSSAWHKNAVYLLINSCFSFAAAVMISLGEINSSTVIEKKAASSLRESIFGYPLPDSHLDTAVLETKIACASSSCVSPVPFLNSCSFH